MTVLLPFAKLKRTRSDDLHFACGLVLLIGRALPDAEEADAGAGDCAATGTAPPTIATGCGNPCSFCSSSTANG